MMNRFFGRAQALLLPAVCSVILMAGCATEVGSFTPITRTYPPKLPKTQVDVFTTGMPSRSFERVAILDVHCESQGFMTPNLKSDGIPKLIEQARAAGCDAIIEIREKAAQANWTLETSVKNYTAVGVAYK